jgi:tRNA C32,U32 (ribose-2'-O)-methylase TrmJ
MSQILRKQGIEADAFTQQELNYLLALVSRSNFEGRDVFVLADVVNKLKAKIKSNETGNK